MQDCRRFGWRGKNEPRLCTWRCRLVHELPKTVEENESMEIEMHRVFESAPAANRDSDSYKQPLLASLRAMIGLMRHLNERNPLVFEKECAGKR